MEIKKGIYRHYKGNLYEVIDVASHSETLEPMVVYRALYGDKKLWSRPAGMWDEIVEVDGKKTKRFELIKQRYSYEDLLGVITKLRAPDGCPWDREQTHESIKKHLIEECYETLDALDSGDAARFCDELGDLLFQIVFHAEMASEKASFDMGDVVHGCANKMITRHPKVFGEGDIPETAEEQLRQWDKIKEKEKGTKTVSDLLDDIPVSQPAMMRALKIQQRVAKVGFDWDKLDDVLAKVEEELGEVKEALALEKQQEVAKELGDVLFAVINLARHMDVQPEIALHTTNEKFTERFKFIEKKAAELGVKLEDMSLEEMDKYWGEAKNEIG